MTANLIFFVAGVSVLALVLVVVAWRSYSHARRAVDVPWENLLKKLEWVNPQTVREIALDFLGDSGPNGESSRQRALDAARISEMVGGIDGLEAMKRNSKVFIDLAAHLQHWYPEALSVAEELRQEARQMEWHIGRLRGAMKTGNLEVSFPSYGQHAIAIYYRMTRELLALCERADVPLFAELQKAL